jgi:chromosome partitioning protein
VVFASSKGGATCACVSVRAAQEFAKVAMIDVDSSHGLEDWAKRRNQGQAPRNPRMFTTRQVHNVVDHAMMLKAQGWQWIIFIDSPPAPTHGFEEAIKAADIVIIPIKASPLDAVATGAAPSERTARDSRDGRRNSL